MNSNVPRSPEATETEPRGSCKSSFAVSMTVAMLGVTAWAVAANSPVYDQAPVNWDHYQKLWLKDLPRATPEEALLSTYNEEKAKNFLDDTALKWARQNRCGTCHTTIPYLMARPLIGSSTDRADWKEVRETVANFASDRIANHSPYAAFTAGTTAAALTIGDALSGRDLEPDARALFEYMWASQGADGAWVIPQEGMLPFLERDSRYVAIMVALGVGYAPGRYYEDPSAKAGFAKLQGFIRSNLPSSVHDKSVLLWASIRTPGLLTAGEQADYVRSLLALQKDDGGWALPSLGMWPRHDGAPNDPQSDSDGYATSLAALVLCQRGYSVKDLPVRRAVAWVQHHQRISGRWYTRSLYSDKFQNYLSNMGTAYAVMALTSCRASES